MGEMRNACKILIRKSEKKKRYKGLILDGRIILTWVLKKYSVRFWKRFTWLSNGSSGKFL
jgi:hypothetical protein